MRLGGERDVIGVELVIDGEMQEVDVFDEVEDDECVMRAVLVVDYLALVFFEGLGHIAA